MTRPRINLGSDLRAEALQNGLRLGKLFGVTVRLDWTDERVEARVSAMRERTAAVDDAEREAASHASRPANSKDLPPALAAMMQDRREEVAIL